MEWEKIFANVATDKGLINSSYNSISKTNTNNPFRTWAGDLNRHFSKDTQMSHRHMKRCSTSLNANQNVRQTHNKIPPYICQNGHHLKSINNKCQRGCGEKGSSYTVSGNINLYYGKLYGASF